MVLRDHQLPLEEAWVYDNTVYTTGWGIDFGSTARQDALCVGNLVYADGTPIRGGPANTHDNLVGATTDAAGVVVAPSTTLGQMDFHPLAGQATGAALDASGVSSDVDYDRDFDGRQRDFTVRGAYATGGPGWTLQRGIKVVGQTGTGGADGGLGDGGVVDGGGGAGDGGSGGAVDGGTGGGADGGTGAHDGAGGCGCSAGTAAGSDGALLLAILTLGVSGIRRRRAKD